MFKWACRTAAAVKRPSAKRRRRSCETRTPRPQPTTPTTAFYRWKPLTTITRCFLTPAPPNCRWKQQVKFNERYVMLWLVYVWNRYYRGLTKTAGLSKTSYGSNRSVLDRPREARLLSVMPMAIFFFILVKTRVV